MPTRSPRRVKQLCFLLCRELTVRSTGILERRCSLSLSLKNKNPKLIASSSTLPFLSQKVEKMTLFQFCPIIIKHSHNSLRVPSLGFLTLGTISAIHFHHLSSLVTCVKRVHVIGDFCHITCLSNSFYGN